MNINMNDRNVYICIINALTLGISLKLQYAPRRAILSLCVRIHNGTDSEPSAKNKIFRFLSTRIFYRAIYLVSRCHRVNGYK